MKNLFFYLVFGLLAFQNIQAQTPASRTFVAGIGVTTCGGSGARFQSFTYNSNTNLLLNGVSCAPLLSPSFSQFRSVTIPGITGFIISEGS
jgi:hypothetical protein